jgi:hypothetical protein
MEIAGIIEGHIYAGIRIARLVPEAASGRAAQRALAASLAASCLTALGLRPGQECHQRLADILSVAPGPCRGQRLIDLLEVIDLPPSGADDPNGGSDAQ